MKRKKTKLLMLGLVASILIGTMGQAKIVDAKINNDMTVKVGYYYSKNFQEGACDEEMKKGYAYEYLQKVADYAGWKYEYVYGGWTDLLEALEEGKIDVMCGVSYTDERAEYISFPSYKMGEEQYYLYQHEGGNMDIADKSSFNGFVIGAIYNNVMTDCLMQWSKDNDIDLNIRYYASLEDRDEQFAQGAIDGFVATDSNVVVDSKIEPVSKIGSEDYYLAVNKKRVDILETLNQALDVMHSINPYYLENLQYTSYDNSIRINDLTVLEKEWIATHDTLRIGYLKNYLPYCDEDENGNATGLLVDVIEAILKELKISNELIVEYEAFQSYQESLEAIQEGRIDALFPTGGNHWFIEQDGLAATTSVVTASIDLAYRGNYSEDAVKSIAVNKNNKIQYYYTVT